ncbi:hypothetical protein HYT23_05605 [Candidatus Pacearchaeota archaeon]|nr:hypothetical protein [Candidatus Pacearchaeota archaeon]
MHPKHRKYLPIILRDFHYPKSFLLIIAILTAYLLFKNSSISSWINSLESITYLGTFIAGMLLAFPFSVGFFLALNQPNILQTAIIGGFGALMADLLIFNIIKVSFNDEFQRLKETEIIKDIDKIIKKDFGKRLEHYILYAFAGILIATPLPDEAGMSMLAGLTHIKQKVLALISFVLHTFGILMIILIGN